MDEEKTKMIRGMFFPLLFVLLLWVIKICEDYSSSNWSFLGIYPRKDWGLWGILFAPLVHGDYAHLISNTIPLFILGSIMFYFYRAIAFQVFFWVYIITGIWVWVAARSAYHIGASGIVYGYVCFLFFSGIFRRDNRLLAMSLLVTFVYGSLIWGIFPFKKGVSWESHLLGSVAGFITAIHFRKEGPQPKKYDWEDESDEEEDTIEYVDAA